MKYDIILCGVGGQGVLSLAAIIASAAVRQGYKVRQSEVHGMSQRGGAVVAHLRLSDSDIFSDLIPIGTASMVLSMEPLESLRYVSWLKEGGMLVTAAEPFNNITNYPPLDDVLSAVRRIPRHLLVPAADLARKAGSVRSSNMVMIGAASADLPFSADMLIASIEEMFAAKGDSMVALNKAAFASGSEAGREVYAGREAE
ncbi:MAG: indolepyruvate oxidoreductase subunit beta [Spirochaetales bacterium]|nr:MAG: indolepyruvate oxidoreductase subunit beta [Spirochaetales bacterium]